MPLQTSSYFGMELMEAVEKHAEFPAFMSRERVLTYRDFSNLSKAIALRMSTLGIGRDSIVCLNSNDAAVVMATIVATALLGAKFVIANKLLAQTQAFRPTIFLRTGESTGSPNVPFQILDDAWIGSIPVKELSSAVWEGPASGDSPWLILHTTGSTGSPKYFTLSQNTVAARTRAIATDYPERSVTAAFLHSFESRPFFARACGILKYGCTIVDSNDPSFWEEAGVNYVSGSPSATDLFLKHNTITNKVKKLETSGAPISLRDVERYLSVFDEVEDVYGAGETNKTYSYTYRRLPSGEIQRTGNPTDSEIQIVEADGNICRTGQVGLIRVRNGYLSSGYFNSPEATAKAFRDGWFYSGDTAFWSEDGILHLQGRTDGVFNIGGQKLAAKLIDLVLKSVPGVKDGASFMNPKPNVKASVLAFIEVEEGASESDVRYHAVEICKEKLGFVFAPKKIHVIDKIPKTTKGEPSRKACQDLLLEGFLKSKSKSKPKT